MIKETVEQKKIRLLNAFSEELHKKVETDPSDESFITIDNNVPKNSMLLTDHETGEQLLLKMKFTKDDMIVTKITIPKKKKVNDTNTTK